jgi:hypothetical protein
MNYKIDPFTNMKAKWEDNDKSITLMLNQKFIDIMSITVSGKITPIQNDKKCKCASLPLKDGKNFLSYVTTSYVDGVDKPKMYMMGANLFGNGHPQEVELMTGNNKEEVSKFVKLGQLMCLEKFEENKNEKYLGILPNIPQFRMISSLVGEYELTENDLKKVKNSSCGVFGDFLNKGNYYELPYEILFNKSITNMYVAGRIVSSSGMGWEVTRVIPVCVLSGEVTGLAVSLLKQTNKDNNSLDIKLLQEKLVKRGIKLHY